MCCWWCWNSFFPAGRCFLTAAEKTPKNLQSACKGRNTQTTNTDFYLRMISMISTISLKIETHPVSRLLHFILVWETPVQKDPSGIWSIAFSQSTLHLHTYTSIGGCIRRSVSGFTSSWTTIGKVVLIKLTPSPELGGMQLFATVSSPVSILIVLFVSSPCDSTISFRASISLRGWLQVPLGLAESFLGRQAILSASLFDPLRRHRSFFFPRCHLSKLHYLTRIEKRSALGGFFWDFFKSSTSLCLPLISMGYLRYIW